MARINPSYAKLSSPYIFPIIEKKMMELSLQSDARSVINLGIGDVALPLAPVLVQAICRATEEMGQQETRRGYGPSEGYPFLREAIAKHNYGHLKVEPSEIFVSDGTNSDVVNIPELFAPDCVVAIPDPTYPAYLSSTIMSGRGDRVTFLPCTEKNNFLPQPPNHPVDLIFLCTPGNPTGVALDYGTWEKWIHYAKKVGAIIIHDNAYAAFIRSPGIPSSAYEIPGGKEVVIECCSFSKIAGFTGLRCAYAVLPHTLPDNLHAMWKKRQGTKFNGVAYPIQKGAEASFTPEGKLQLEPQVASYGKQAEFLSLGLKQLGHTCYGGIDAPYIWWKTPGDLNSWEFFDQLLDKCRLLAIPGHGFGSLGEGYVRLSAFTTPEHAHEAIRRIGDM